jgi:hypothetical protein
VEADYAIENGARAEGGNLLVGTDSCPYCDDDGLIGVGYSKAGTLQAAPCPRCRKGYQVEFAVGIHKRRTGNRTVYEEAMGDMPRPWKPHGFWEGKNVAEYGQAVLPGYTVPEPGVSKGGPSEGTQELPPRENYLRTKLLNKRIEQRTAGVEEGIADPCVGLGIGDAVMRMRMVEAEIVRVGLE